MLFFKNIIFPVDVDEDWKREIFQTTVPMSTYLIAFSISGKTLIPFNICFFKLFIFICGLSAKVTLTFLVLKKQLRNS